MLSSGLELTAAVTNPDRRAGRGLRGRPSPVKAAAQAAGIRVLQPQSIKDPSFQGVVRALRPEVCIVVAYGKILPPTLLEVPDMGFINVHFSLLPAYRGAAPVQRALMDGATETGVSIMRITEGMDEGPVLAARKVAVSPADSSASLGERLAADGGDLLIPTVLGYASGAVKPQPQDDRAATYAPKISEAETRIDWSKPHHVIHNLVRGLEPAPGAWTTFRGKRIKIRAVADVGEEAPALAPGELLAGDLLLVGTRGDPLEVSVAQSEGKRAMSGAELARGLRLEPSEAFG
ncbi:MAG: methionyl-tRNA formyltransferase [Actinomycetota bacterium]|nr:methionyl-tRNA formyltransferase [Actinomycetota bacterium]